MATQRWEYNRIIINVNTTPVEKSGFATFYHYSHLSGTEWMDREIGELGRAGWELVAAVPLTGGRAKEAEGINWGVSYTYAVCLFFKRPLA